MRANYSNDGLRHNLKNSDDLSGGGFNMIQIKSKGTIMPTVPLFPIRHFFRKERKRKRKQVQIHYLYCVIVLIQGVKRKPMIKYIGKIQITQLTTDYLIKPKYALNKKNRQDKTKS